MTRKYEVMYILDQDVKDVKEIQTKLNGLLSNGGKIVESADWGLMDFAYEINHKAKGYYSVVVVETTTEAIDEFKRVAGIDKNVVRTLVLNTENVQGYEQSTKLSKTDMTKYEEERRERKNNFKKPFERKDEVKTEAPVEAKEEKVAAPKAEAKPAAKKPAAKKEISADDQAAAKKAMEDLQAKYAAKLEAEEAAEAKRLAEEEAAHQAELAAAKDEAERAAKQKAREDKLKAEAEAKAKMSTDERAKLDGSDDISEPRSELQKHANAMRSMAPDSQKAIHEANLRDMTKKELVKYMAKISKVMSK